jgi:hypothetical protein
MARNIPRRVIRQSHISATPYLRDKIPSTWWETLQPSEQSVPVFDVEGGGSVDEVGAFGVDLFAGEREAGVVGGDFDDGGCVDVLVNLVAEVGG